jgi:uncharacterized protein YecE (DUF72 family)
MGSAHRLVDEASIAPNAGTMGSTIGSWKKQGCDIFVYFHNDQKSAAPGDALELQQPLGHLEKQAARNRSRPVKAR